MPKSDLTGTWRSEVERRFDFLHPAFVGPVFDEERESIEYASADYVITAHYGGRYRELGVRVTSVATDPRLAADLSDLYVGAGLGPAQAVGQIGRSEHSITKAVA